MKCGLSCLRDLGGVPSHNPSKRANDLVKNCNHCSDSCQLFQRPVLLAQTSKQADRRNQQTLIWLVTSDASWEFSSSTLCCTLQPEETTALFSNYSLNYFPSVQSFCKPSSATAAMHSTLLTHFRAGMSASHCSACTQCPGREHGNTPPIARDTVNQELGCRRIPRTNNRNMCPYIFQLCGF